ncbi:MAG: V-type ATP synthase subunit I [Firmicutes bacterium]|nr:V-type ATP synthase subunit I [Bacillota bacterium]
MAIVKMHKVSIIGLERDKAEILENLMNIGVLDVSDIGSKASSEEWTEMVNSDGQEEEVLKLESDIEKVKSALEYLSLYDKRKKAFFKPKRVIDASIYGEIIEDKEKLWSVVEEINKLDEKLTALKTEKNRLENFINTLEPWKSVEIPVDLTSTRTTGIMFGVVPVTVDTKQMISDIEKEIQECYIQLVNTDKDQAYLQIIFHNSREEELIKSLKQSGFNRVTFDIKGTVKENIDTSVINIEKIEAEREKLKEAIAEYVNQRNNLEVLYDYLNIQRDKKAVLGRLLRTDKVFILEGWVPDHAVKIFKNDVAKNWHWDCIVDIREPGQEEEYPILLENNRFVEPFELVTELYSLPKPTGIDPNPFMAPFFFIFFGLMVSDAGYGLLMALATAFVLYKFKPGETVGKLLKLLFWGGVSTFIWGALFGGWFGDIVEKVSSGNFKLEPLWFNPLTDPMKLLLWSFIFGGIQLYVGMGLKGYNLIREGKVLDAVFDIGFWYILLTGLALLLVGGNAAIIGKYMSITGVILLILTQGRHEKNIVKKLIKGVVSLYNAVGFMSDVLSYSRLLALGLATGVIASVINTIGTLLGFSLPGIIVLIFAFVIGHIFNILINALGAFVHSSRLQYVEFFSKFYEGGGKPYKPFKINTKYINIVDGRKV